MSGRIIDRRKKQRVGQSPAAHSTATIPWPTAGNISEPKIRKRSVGQAHALEPGACHDERVGRADLAAAGKPLLFQTVKLAHAGVGGAAIVNDFHLRKQPAGIGRATHALVPILKPPPRERLNSSSETPGRTPGHRRADRA